MILAAAAAAAVSCSARQSRGVSGPKLVILGFDGMDPDLVRRYMAEGRLPNMAKLAAQGGLADLETRYRYREATLAVAAVDVRVTRTGRRPFPVSFWPFRRRAPIWPGGRRPASATLARSRSRPVPG
mgnify:CR=1 FL=1